MLLLLVGEARILCDACVQNIFHDHTHKHFATILNRIKFENSFPSWHLSRNYSHYACNDTEIKRVRATVGRRLHVIPPYIVHNYGVIYESLCANDIKHSNFIYISRPDFLFSPIPDMNMDKRVFYRAWDVAYAFHKSLLPHMCTYMNTTHTDCSKEKGLILSNDRTGAHENCIPNYFRKKGIRVRRLSGHLIRRRDDIKSSRCPEIKSKR